MTCADAARLIGPWMDDELDARSVVEIELHVARCAACGQEKEQLLALRQAARERLPRHPLPAGLEERIDRALRKSARPPRRWARELTLVAAAAGVALLASTALRRPEARDEILDAHLRSLQAQHLTDVASSDQHTVKPWFQGRLAFAVPVRDFAAQGFPLAGGRLDVMEGRTVAALVYRRRLHVINLFVWPSSRGETSPHTATELGFRETSWSHDGFEYRLVSDASDLDELVALLRSP